MKCNGRLISHAALTVVSVFLCQVTGWSYLSQEVFSALRVICLDLLGRVGRKQVLAVLLKLSVMEADSPFQWALASHGSVCKATVCQSLLPFRALLQTA